MALKFGDNNVKKVTYNNKEVRKIYFNNNLVWSANEYKFYVDVTLNLISSDYDWTESGSYGGCNGGEWTTDYTNYNAYIEWKATKVRLTSPDDDFSSAKVKTIKLSYTPTYSNEGNWEGRSYTKTVNSNILTADANSGSYEVLVSRKNLEGGTITFYSDTATLELTIEVKTNDNVTKTFTVSRTTPSINSMTSTTGSAMRLNQTMSMRFDFEEVIE